MAAATAAPPVLDVAGVVVAVTEVARRLGVAETPPGGGPGGRPGPDPPPGLVAARVGVDGPCAPPPFAALVTCPPVAVAGLARETIVTPVAVVDVAKDVYRVARVDAALDGGVGTVPRPRRGEVVGPPAFHVGVASREGGPRLGGGRVGPLARPVGQTPIEVGVGTVTTVRVAEAVVGPAFRPGVTVDAAGVAPEGDAAAAQVQVPLSGRRRGLRGDVRRPPPDVAGVAQDGRREVGRRRDAGAVPAETNEMDDAVPPPIPLAAATGQVAPGRLDGEVFVALEKVVEDAMVDVLGLRGVAPMEDGPIGLPYKGPRALRPTPPPAVLLVRRGTARYWRKTFFPWEKSRLRLRRGLTPGLFYLKWYLSSWGTLLLSVLLARTSHETTVTDTTSGRSGSRGNAARVLNEN